MLKVHIPTPLRQYAGKMATVEVQAGTVAEALNKLVNQHPDLRRHLYNDEGKLRAFVNVYLNDEDIRYLQKEDTTVKDTDNLSIVPSIAGGVDLVDFSSYELQPILPMCCCPACCCR
ncbi:MAG TPA: ubiquitin-like small modifier protein 1 [Terriglobales bacterium]|nr:ubiquitin-like small modifier protein 1 [Terriglobales bacterium]